MSVNCGCMNMWLVFLTLILLSRFSQWGSSWVEEANGPTMSLVVAEAWSSSHGDEDGSGTCLGDGLTEAPGLLVESGRSDTLLRRMLPYLTWPDCCTCAGKNCKMSSFLCAWPDHGYYKHVWNVLTPPPKVVGGYVVTLVFLCLSVCDLQKQRFTSILVCLVCYSVCLSVITCIYYVSTICIYANHTQVTFSSNFTKR